MASRIKSINIDAILSTGTLEGLVEDNSYTLFPQFSITERPDTTSHHILKGRIAIVHQVVNWSDDFFIIFSNDG